MSLINLPLKAANKLVWGPINKIAETVLPEPTRDAASPLGRDALTLSSRQSASKVAKAADAAAGAVKKNPVVFIPGFFSHTVSFAAVQDDLEKAGYDKFAKVDFWPGFSSIDGYAQRAKEVVDRVRAETGADKVEIVAHSMGGLVGLKMIKDFHMEDQVDSFVSFGTPYHGTDLQKVLPGSGQLPDWLSANQMTYQGKFVQGLMRDGEAPKGVKVTSIRAGADEVVFPHSSPVLQGAENYNVPLAMHNEMLFDPRARKIAVQKVAE